MKGRHVKFQTKPQVQLKFPFAKRRRQPCIHWNEFPVAATIGSPRDPYCKWCTHELRPAEEGFEYRRRDSTPRFPMLRSLSLK